MTILQIGSKALDFTFQTPWSETNQFYDVLKNKKTILLFLRYYGCSLCQLDIAALVSGIDKIEANNAQVLVVLQTEASLIREQLTQEQMPLTLICDPEHELFTLYDVAAGESQAELISEEAIEKINVAREQGITKIDNRGKEIELQLPATFIIDSDGVIQYVRYGTHAADVPAPAELVELTSNNVVLP